MTLGNFARCSIIPMIPKFSKHLLKVYLVLVLQGWNTFSKGYLEHIRAYCAVRWVPAKFPLVAILRWGQGTTAGKEGPPAKEMHIYLLPMNIYISLSLQYTCHILLPVIIYNTHATFMNICIHIFKYIQPNIISHSYYDSILLVGCIGIQLCTERGRGRERERVGQEQYPANEHTWAQYYPFIFNIA
jgi:hypothetical protein